MSQQEHGLHVADHVAALGSQLLERGGISLLRHDAAHAGELSLRQHEPRGWFGILGVNVLRELPELNGGDYQDARHLETAVDGSKMIRVVGVFDQSVKAQQDSEPL